MTVKTTTAATFCSPAPITVPAATHMARFLGLTAASRNPSPVALPAVMVSIADIHLGRGAFWPGSGLDFHCLTARSINSTHSSSLTHDARVDEPLSASADLVSRTKAVTATTIPATH